MSGTLRCQVRGRGAVGSGLGAEQTGGILRGRVEQLTGQRSKQRALGQREQPMQKPWGGSMFLGGVVKEASEEGNDV